MFYFFFDLVPGAFPCQVLEKDLGSTFVDPCGKGDVKKHYKMTDNI